jgi:hypothetical protein
MANFEATPPHRVRGAGPRVDDQQRNETVDQLSSAVATGKLSADEFEERSERALTARTRADLDVLVDDLDAALPVKRARASTAVVTLTAADIARALAFALVTGVIVWVVGGYAWPYQYEQRLLVWLFGLACGAAGAALRRRA